VLHLRGSQAPEPVARHEQCPTQPDTGLIEALKTIDATDSDRKTYSALLEYNPALIDPPGIA
jgi:hypothetical protein